MSIDTSNIAHYSLTKLSQITHVNENTLREWKRNGWLTGLKLSELRVKYTIADFNRAKALCAASFIESALKPTTKARVPSTKNKETWEDVRNYAKRMKYI
jgi:hypothetical protein